MKSHLLLNDFNNSEYDQKMRQNQDIGHFFRDDRQARDRPGTKKDPGRMNGRGLKFPG